MAAEHDDRTVNRAYPLPHPDNMMPDDAARLRESISGIDTDIGEMDATQQTMGGRISRHLFETEIQLWE
ncbi:MAG: hypothetical protein HQL72_09025 [Magnetococcales bacterium]|nr:hypothetical protein [Magnetococcales bacterium]